MVIAGSDEKLIWCREIGFDGRINQEADGELAAAVKATCPNGVDD